MTYDWVNSVEVLLILDVYKKKIFSFQLRNLMTQVETIRHRCRNI